MNEPCPSAETLAAYGDGKLTPTERSAVEKHVAACEDCFELFAGAAAFRLEEEAGSPVVAYPSAGRLRFRRWYAAAAAAAIALAVLTVVRQQSTAISGGAEVLALANGLGDAEALEAAAARAWTDDGGGLGFGGGLPASKRAFRLGVHLFDARVALDAGDAERLRAALDRTAPLLPSRGDAAEISERMRESVARKGKRSRNRVDLDRLADAARRVDTAAFDLGAWAEAGRLAALGGRAELLAPTFAARLGEMAPRGTAEPAQARALGDIRAALADRQISANELAALERSFEQLILLN